jgi:hypothetical protein
MGRNTPRSFWKLSSYLWSLLFLDALASQVYVGFLPLRFSTHAFASAWKWAGWGLSDSRHCSRDKYTYIYLDICVPLDLQSAEQTL